MPTLHATSSADLAVENVSRFQGQREVKAVAARLTPGRRTFHFEKLVTPVNMAKESEVRTTIGVRRRIAKHRASVGQQQLEHLAIELVAAEVLVGHVGPVAVDDTKAAAQIPHRPAP